MHKLRLAAILAAIAVVAGIFLSNQIFMQPPGVAASVNDVVIIACYSNSEGNPPIVPFSILTASSSENAPVVARGSDCAQALADLTSAGFVIVDVQPSPVNLAGQTYTLVRTAEK